MKNLSIAFIVILSFLLLAGCSQENDILIDESVLSELSSFEYLGYTYYVHPRLSTKSDLDYDEFKKEVKSLDSYGFKAWFIPSLNELRQAAGAGLIPKIENLMYVSSSMDGNHHLCLTYEYGDGWISDWRYYYGYYTVFPMIKFRK